MLMDQETILTLYREAVDKGDPGKIIKSLAKTNNVAPGEIRQILADAGEFVPRQKRGRPKAAVINREFEEAVNEMVSESDKRGTFIDAVDTVPEEADCEQHTESNRVGNIDDENAQKAAGSEELPEAAGYGGTHEERQTAAGNPEESLDKAHTEEKTIRLNFVLKECLYRGVQDIKKQLMKKKEEVEARKIEIEQLEKLYYLARCEYAGILWKEEAEIVHETGSEAGQIP